MTDTSAAVEPFKPYHIDPKFIVIELGLAPQGIFPWADWNRLSDEAFLSKDNPHAFLLEWNQRVFELCHLADSGKITR
jgi:hypothetical protein